jgi:uroporphyrinogen decarboxylase
MRSSNQIPTSPAEARAFLLSHYGQPEAASISPRQRVEMALRHEEPDRVPFDFWAVPEVWAALRCYLDTDDDADVLRLLGVDCRWVRPDYVGPAPIAQEDGSYYDAFGTHRRSVSNEFCTYEEYAGHPLAGVQTVAEVESWPGWPPTEHWDVSTLKDKIQTLNRETEYWLCYEVGGIFEWSWGLRGFEQFLMDLVTQPEIACAIMDRYTDLYIANVTRVLEAAASCGRGIDMVYTYDDMGTQRGLLISKTLWRELILPRHLRLNAAIRRFPVKIMYHSCGAIYPLIGALADELGIDVLNPLQPQAAGMDAARIKREFGDRLSFYGAVDIQRTLPRGTPQQVQVEVQERCRMMGRGGGYICASAHYIQADTPLENIVAMYTTPREP